MSPEQETNNKRAAWIIMAVGVIAVAILGYIVGKYSRDTRKDVEQPSIAAIDKALSAAKAISRSQVPVKPAWPACSMPPGVYLINKNYDRTKPLALIRRIVEPTRARMDYAAYTSNAMLFDARAYTPAEPDHKITLAELDFDGAIVPGSICDRLDNTPLSKEEKAYPLAWRPATEYLDMNDEEGTVYSLLETGARISSEKWADADIVPAYQEITTLYIHHTVESAELWVKVEFKPWAGFMLNDVDDEDRDKFPEFYGRVNPDAVSATAIELLTGDYSTTVLSPREVSDWAYDLGSIWYPSYKTYTLKPEPEANTSAGAGMGLEALDGQEVPALPEDELSVLPESVASSIPENVMADLRQQEAFVIIWGAPFEVPIWNFFFINGSGNAP